MARDTKVGMLLGLGIILLVGIIVSDQLAVTSSTAGEMTRFADPAQAGVDGVAHQPATVPIEEEAAPRPAPPDRPIPLPFELESPSRDAEATPTPVRAYQLTRAADRPDASAPAPAPGELVLDGRPATGDRPDASREVAGETGPGQVPGEATPREAWIIHHVEDGESLWDIAVRYYDNGHYWRSIREANPDAVSEDGAVRAGVRLRLPDKAGRANRPTPQAAASPARTIKVEPGDTLSELAARHLGSARAWEILLKANRDRINNPERLRVGQELVLPRSDS